MNKIEGTSGLGLCLSCGCALEDFCFAADSNKSCSCTSTLTNCWNCGVEEFRRWEAYNNKQMVSNLCRINLIY